MRRSFNKGLAFAIAMCTCLTSFGGIEMGEVQAKESKNTTETEQTTQAQGTEQEVQSVTVLEDTADYSVVGQNVYDDGVSWGQGYLMLQDGDFSEGVDENTTLTFIDGEGNQQQVSNNQNGTAVFDKIYTAISWCGYGEEFYNDEEIDGSSVNVVDNTMDNGYILGSKANKYAFMTSDGTRIGNTYYDDIAWVNRNMYMGKIDDVWTLYKMDGTVIATYPSDAVPSAFSDRVLIKDSSRGCYDIYNASTATLVNSINTTRELSQYGQNLVEFTDEGATIYNKDGNHLADISSDYTGSVWTLYRYNMLISKDKKTAVNINGETIYQVTEGQEEICNPLSDGNVLIQNKEAKTYYVATTNTNEALRTVSFECTMPEWFDAAQYNVYANLNYGNDNEATFYITAYDITTGDATKQHDHINTTFCYSYTNGIYKLNTTIDGSCSSINNGVIYAHSQSAGKIYVYSFADGTLLYSLDLSNEYGIQDMGDTFDCVYYGNTGDIFFMNRNTGEKLNNTVYKMLDIYSYTNNAGEEKSTYQPPTYASGMFAVGDGMGTIVFNDKGETVIPSGVCDSFELSYDVPFVIGRNDGQLAKLYNGSTKHEINVSSFDDLGTMSIEGFAFKGEINGEVSDGDVLAETKQEISETGMALTHAASGYGVICLDKNNVSSDYTITYIMNGGTNNSANPISYNEATADITLQNPNARKGYTFAGWYSDSSFKTKVTKIAKGSSGDKILYAKWTINKYNIKFNGNGSTSGSMTQLSNQAYNTNVKLTSNAFKKTYYSFTGWNTKADGKGTKYANGATVTGLSATNGVTVNLYAQWALTKYTITYSGMSGATQNSANPTYYTYSSKNAVALKNPSKKGYTFAGWYSDSKLTKKVTQIDAKSSGAKTFYAKWTKNNYSITYDVNGGKNSGSNPASYTVTSDTITLKNPSKTGNTFKGWFTDEKWGTKVTSIAKGSTGNKKVYAKWSVNTYTITYSNMSGAIQNSANPSKYTYNKDKAVALKNPSKKGYTFAGWYSDSKLTKKVTEIAKGSTGNKTFYPKWTKNTYKITYNLNGGKNSSGNPATYTVTSSTITLKNPSKTGYTFQGWYSDSKLTKKVTEVAKGSTGNRTLYAKWSTNKYKVVFDGNGNTNTSTIMNAMTCTYNKEATLTKNAYSRSKYKFVGWNTKKDGKGKSYSNGAKIKNLTSKSGATVTLYAQWKKK